MRQRSSVESPTQSSAIVDIHPKLQRALEHIDVCLEEELTRYRRQKAGLAVAPTGAGEWQRKSVAKPVELPLDRPPLPQLTSGQPPARTESAPNLHPPIGAAAIDTAQAAGFSAPSDLDLFAATEDEMPPGSLQTRLDEDDDRFSLADNAAQLDDYLESSEELLKSLASQKAQVEVEKSFLDHLVTPLGIGSMFMLLLSSAMLGYVIMNPSSLAALGRLVPSFTAAPAPAPVAVTPEPAGPIANSPPLDAQEFVDLGLGHLTALGSRPNHRLGAVPALPSLKGKTAVKLPVGATPRVTIPGAGVTVTGPIAPQPPFRIPAGPPIPTRSIPAARNYSGPSLYPVPSRASSAPARSYNPAPARSQPALPQVNYTPQPPAPLPSIRITPADSYREPSPAPPVESRPIAVPSPANSTSAEIGVRYTGDLQLEQVQKIVPGATLDNTADGAVIRVPLDKVQDLHNQGIPVEAIPNK
jgi:hypothetical protein